MYAKLREILGDEDANTLMEHLPPVGWADVATRRDLDHVTALLRADLQREIAQLGSDLRSDIGAVRDDVGAVRIDMTRYEGELSSMEGRLTALVHQELAALIRTFIVAMVVAMATIASLAFAAAHLT
jgi:hypothetical protein